MTTKKEAIDELPNDGCGFPECVDGIQGIGGQEILLHEMAEWLDENKDAVMKYYAAREAEK